MANSHVKKILRIEADSFIGDDGKEITGKYIYLVPHDGGEAPKRKFFSDQMLAGMSYKPQEGDDVYVFCNDYGRVVDMLKA